MDQVIINRLYIHANSLISGSFCGGKIEEIRMLDRLENKFHCLKCGESWNEQIEISLDIQEKGRN